MRGNLAPIARSVQPKVSSRPVRRLFIVLLAIVLPLKAWAGVMLPVAVKAGAGEARPSVVHAGTAMMAHGEQGAASGEDRCEPQAGVPAAAHECPHVVMPVVVASPQQLTFAASRLPPPTLLASRPSSIVLDVPLPPPLALR